jgi:hypothetical protein
MNFDDDSFIKLISKTPFSNRVSMIINVEMIFICFVLLIQMVATGGLKVAGTSNFLCN